MDYERNYSQIVKDSIPYVIGGALIATGIWIGHKLHKKNLEDISEETIRLAKEMTQFGIGSN